MSHVLVLGASMAGMLAARVLSEHFDRVTIIERDKLPLGPEFRPGTPQARHAHALLAQGQEIMEDLFPGLKDDFARIGAPSMVWGSETASLTPGGWVKRFDSGIVTNVCTRVGLEWCIRRRLAAYDNITILEEHQITGLLTTPDHATVTGVRVEAKRGTETRDILADLVVDATGRSSKTPEWLVAMGYDAPEETIVNAYLGYATRWYQAPPGFTCDWKVMAISARPETGLLRGGGIFRVEGDQWLAILAGSNKDYPPTDEPGFLDFARSLPTQALYEAIQYAEPISPIYGYRRTENCHRHYERLTRFPERLVVTGDAYCGFNPIYGQGMTVAALDARALGELLHEQGTADLTGFGRRAHQRLALAVENAWLMATGEDLRYPGTDGTRPGFPARLIQRYLDRVIRALPRDEAVALAFMQAMNLTRAPSQLFQPHIMWNVLLDTFAAPLAEGQNAPVQSVVVPVTASGD